MKLRSSLLAFSSSSSVVTLHKRDRVERSQIQALDRVEGSLPSAIGAIELDGISELIMSDKDMCECTQFSAAGT